MAASAFEFYAAGSSWLHRLDPRVKLAVVACISILSFFWLSIPLLAIVIIGVHVVLLTSGYPARRLIAAWRAIAPVLILIIIIWPILDRQGRLLFEIGPLRIHSEGLLRGFANAGRIAAINVVFILWIGVTGPRELVRGFVRLGVPFRWGMSLTIALRFIPTFAATWSTVMDALQARGLVLHGRWYRRVRQLAPVLVAALVSALRASEQLAMTLDARAFGATPHRTVLRDIQMRRSDWLCLGLLLGGTLLLGWLTLTAGLGRDLLSIW